MKNLIIILSLVLLATGCKKEKDVETHDLRVLEVRLDGDYITAEKIDSAIAIWESGGTTQQLRFAFFGDTLRLPIQAFKEGSGTMTVQLYSQVMRASQPLQFEKRWELNLSHQQAVLHWGPGGNEDEEWMPRVILRNSSSPIIIIVGLRPADPYFSLRNLPAKWPLLELERGYYEVPGGVRYAAYKLWKCEGVCGAVVEDRAYFASLGVQAGDKPWSWISIGVGLFSRTDQTSAAYSYGCPR